MSTIITSVLVVFTATMIITGYVLKKTPETQDFETLKIRFAAVTFTGIMVLIFLIAILAVTDTTEAKNGMEVFKIVLTALTPIAGVIAGYLFGAKNK